MQIETALKKIALWGKLVKFSHTIFALPFALSMLAVTSKYSQIRLSQIILIMLCLVCARTAAMCFNRMLDSQLDASNPRTFERELPQGLLSKKSVCLCLLIASLLFLLFSYFLGKHCLILAPLVLLVLFCYSFAKRFTKLSHYFLGLALALAPGGVWYALTAKFALLPIPMMLGVLFWVAGFDILYACQDIDFDRAQSLHSIPARFGAQRAFKFAFSSHLLSLCWFVLFGYLADLNAVYFAGLGLFGVLILTQYRLISPKDLSNIDAAFFTKNGQASLVYMLGTLLAIL